MGAIDRGQKVLDRSGARVGEVLSDIFGVNGRRILDGQANGLGRDATLASLSLHVAHKIEQLGDAPTLALSATKCLETSMPSFATPSPVFLRADRCSPAFGESFATVR